jgi:hypothetical protein
LRIWEFGLLEKREMRSFCGDLSWWGLCLLEGDSVKPLHENGLSVSMGFWLMPILVVAAHCALFLLQSFTSSDYRVENPKMGRIKGNWTLIVKKY